MKRARKVPVGFAGCLKAKWSADFVKLNGIMASLST